MLLLQLQTNSTELQLPVAATVGAATPANAERNAAAPLFKGCCWCVRLSHKATRARSPATMQYIGPVIDVTQDSTARNGKEQLPKGHLRSRRCQPSPFCPESHQQQLELLSRHFPFFHVLRRSE
ncbi:hypothetical protein cyc_03904 [Cyclospora cayetanensis]|uniref:Uncharacterized protein n=1 Tax=Cyclospora cayetanensis TaxID=88456 RepID=A0A1D3CXE4_9EIME|nr:hypothetical protein cyc_03904 [Cyclospora cayetanensis]